jgi:hypothetical protein
VLGLVDGEAEPGLPIAGALDCGLEPSEILLAALPQPDQRVGRLVLELEELRELL